jgi:hypothetical protein
MGNLGSKFLSNRGNWKAILLLSIILPVGLFTGLKLSGIVPTAKLETVTLAPVTWQFNLPTEHMDIDQTLNTTYADASGRVSFQFIPDEYVPDVYGTNDLWLSMNFTATPLNRRFYVRSVLVYFGNDSQPSLIDFESNAGMDTFENLTLKTASWGETAGILFLGNRSGVGCQFSALGTWLLPKASNVTYERQADFEVTYFNGTDYKKVVQPFNLTVQAVGYHYLFIGRSMLAGTNPHAMSSGNVSVDGVEYSTPVSLIVKQGVHNITVPSTIQINGQQCPFIGWFPVGPISPTWICNITEDIGVGSPISAGYLDLPSVTISPSSVSIYIGDSQTFTAAVSGGTLSWSSYVYQWYLNGSAVSGATSASWTFTPSSTGSYAVYVTIIDNFGRRATSNTALVTVIL